MPSKRINFNLAMNFAMVYEFRFWARKCYICVLEPADSFVVGDEVVGTFRGRIIHAISRTTNDQAARIAEFSFVCHRRMPTDSSQSLVLLR